MRLIDADEAKSFAKECWQSDAVRLPIDAFLDRCPTVDAVPVLHARWIWYFNHPVRVHGNAMYETGFRCSACRHGVSIGLHTAKWAETEETMVRSLRDDTTKYCPNCFAKMDGGAEDAAD